MRVQAGAEVGDVSGAVIFRSDGYHLDIHFFRLECRCFAPLSRRERGWGRGYAVATNIVGGRTLIRRCAPPRIRSGAGSSPEGRRKALAFSYSDCGIGPCSSQLIKLLLAASMRTSKISRGQIQSPNVNKEAFPPAAVVFTVTVFSVVNRGR